MKNWSDAWDNNIKIISVTKETKEMLDETHDEIKIGNLTYFAGDVLEAVDPVAFREAMNDYVDAKCEDGEWTQLEDGTVVDTGELNDAIEQKEIEQGIRDENGTYNDQTQMKGD